MTKKELISELSKKTGFTQKDIDVVIDSFVAAVTDSLVKGEDVKVTGLGTFVVAERAARTGHNPKTGESIAIPATKAVKFKVAAPLKNAVKGE